MINQSSSFVQVEMAKTLLPLTTVGKFFSVSILILILIEILILKIDEVRDKINNTNACETLLKLMNSASFEVQGSVATVLANLVNSSKLSIFSFSFFFLFLFLLETK